MNQKIRIEIRSFCPEYEDCRGKYASVDLYIDEWRIPVTSPRGRFVATTQTCRKNAERLAAALGAEVVDLVADDLANNPIKVRQGGPWMCEGCGKGFEEPITHHCIKEEEG